MRAVSSLAAVVLLAACSALSSTRVQPRASTGGNVPAPRYGGVTPPSLTVDPAQGEPIRDVTRPVSAASRRSCRGNTPSGWIATSYEAGADGECARGNDKTKNHPVAVLVRYTALPVGSTLDVCADQHIPFNWIEDTNEQVDVGKCVGARKEGVSDTKRIHRVR